MAKNEAAQTRKRKTRLKAAGTHAKQQSGELAQPIWAVIDEGGCRLFDVTYDEAEESVKTLPGTIITAIAARRSS